MTIKEIKTKAFELSEEKWWDCREEITALEDEQEAAGIGEVVSLADREKLVQEAAAEVAAVAEEDRVGVLSSPARYTSRIRYIQIEEPQAGEAGGLMALAPHVCTHDKHTSSLRIFPVGKIRYVLVQVRTRGMVGG